jgi:hypothetical protein
MVLHDALRHDAGDADGQVDLDAEHGTAGAGREDAVGVDGAWAGAVPTATRVPVATARAVSSGRGVPWT